MKIFINDVEQEVNEGDRINVATTLTTEPKEKVTDVKESKLSKAKAFVKAHPFATLFGSCGAAVAIKSLLKTEDEPEEEDEETKTEPEEEETEE